MSFPNYDNKSKRQERAERLEGLLFVGSLYLLILVIAALARVQP